MTGLTPRRHSLLVVDDNILNQALLKTYLNSVDVEVVMCQTAEKALEVSRAHPPDVVLIDLYIKGTSPFDLCRELRQVPELGDLTIAIAIPNDHDGLRLRGFDSGADYIVNRPYNHTEIQSVVRNVVRLDRFRRLADQQKQLEGLVFELENAYDATIEGWVRALDLRDHETEGHSVRVADMTTRLAHSMGFDGPELVHVRRGALLHDIGKLGVPDSILLKPGKLTDEERQVIELHPEHAFDMLKPVDYLRPAIAIPYCHHDKWDGTGYPQGLKGTEIPEEARIFSVIDVYDELKYDRPYRKGWKEDDVLRYIAGQAGQHFDPDVAREFIIMRINDNGWRAA